MTQTFAESCVDFEVAHLSVLMVQRLHTLHEIYSEIPTLNGHEELCSVCTLHDCLQRNTVVLGLNLKAKVTVAINFC